MWVTIFGATGRDRTVVERSSVESFETSGDVVAWAVPTICVEIVGTQTDVSIVTAKR